MFSGLFQKLVLNFFEVADNFFLILIETEDIGMCIQKDYIIYGKSDDVFIVYDYSYFAILIKNY